MSGRTVFITGCSRGIGLGLTEAFLKRGDTVIATARNPQKSAGLQHLVKSYPKTLHVLTLDVADEKSIEKTVEAVKRISDSVDILINNAGTAGPNHPNDTVLSTTKGAMMSVYETNTVGPMLVAQAFLPLLKAASKKQKDRPARVINISSNLGSIAKNSFGSVTFAREVDDVIFLALSPGWVKTDMGREEAPMTVQQCVDAVLPLIDSLQLKHSGTFLEYDGHALPW